MFVLFILNFRIAMSSFPHRRNAQYFSALEEAPAFLLSPCDSPGSALSFLSAAWNILLPAHADGNVRMADKYKSARSAHN